MFYPVPSGQRPYTTRIRSQFSQIPLNRILFLLDASIHLAFNPSTDLLEYPLDRVQLRTVGRLDDRHKAYIPHLLATVSTRPIPYQRFHVRVMLQLLDRTSYIIRPHRVDPPPHQPPPPNVYCQEQVRPPVHCPYSLHHLHSTTTPYSANHPAQPHTHLIGKAKYRIRTHPRFAKTATEPPFLHALCAPTSALS